MSKIVELKELDDSVDTSIFEIVKADTASLWQGRMGQLLCHPLAVEIPTQEFQHIHERTNENINIYFFIISRYKQNYFFIRMDKREKREISFFEPYNKCVEKIDFQLLHEGSTSTWTENIAETKIMSKVQHGSRSIVNRLKKFATLEAGWDSYNAKPIEWLTITRAIKFFYNILCAMEIENKDVVPLPFIAPRSDGGIQFEWSTCYKELIHSIPEKRKGPIEYLKVDTTSGEEKEEEGEVSSIDDIVVIVTDWLL